MLHHFSLTFQMPTATGDISLLAERLRGWDYKIETEAASPQRFMVHFSRAGDNATELLDDAKVQVQSVLPEAELVGMDMSEAPPMISAVDDITKLVIHACRVFDSTDLAHSWLSSPQEALAGAVPKILMTDAEGRTAVSRVLAELDQA